MGSRINDKNEDKVERGRLGDFHDIDELLGYLRGEIKETTHTKKDLWDELDLVGLKNKRQSQILRDSNKYQLLDHLVYEQKRLEKLIDFFYFKLPNQLQFSQNQYLGETMDEATDKSKMKIFEYIFSASSFLDENLEKIFTDSLSGNK